MKVNIKNKALLASLLVGLSVTELVGCSKQEQECYKLNSMVEALHENDAVSKVDNYLLKGIDFEGENKTLEELDNMFIKYYSSGDVYKCNEIIKSISTAILKAQIAEGFELDYDKIKDFEVIGFLGKQGLDNGKNASQPEYGVSFKYDGKLRQIEATSDPARMICVIARAADKYQLVNDNSQTEFYYFYLPVAYDILSSSLEDSITYKRDKHQITYVGIDEIKTQGYEYDGYFNLKRDETKKENIKNNLDSSQKVLLKQKF